MTTQTRLALGTAKIETGTSTTGKPISVVRYMNHGNWLACDPRAFWNETEAREWCSERGLRVVSC